MTARRSAVRLPVVVLPASGTCYADAVCLVALRDLRTLLGPHNALDRDDEE